MHEIKKQIKVIRCLNSIKMQKCKHLFFECASLYFKVKLDKKGKAEQRRRLWINQRRRRSEINYKRRRNLEKKKKKKKTDLE